MDKKGFIRELDKYFKDYNLSYSQVMRAAELEIDHQLKSIKEGNFPEFDLIAKSAKHNFTKIYRENYFHNKLSNFEKLHFPQIKCDYDNTSGVLFPNDNIGTLDPYKLDQKFSKYFKWAREFSDACFITDVEI